jgi:hypothetical protein
MQEWTDPAPRLAKLVRCGSQSATADYDRVCAKSGSDVP